MSLHIIFFFVDALNICAAVIERGCCMASIVYIQLPLNEAKRGKPGCGFPWEVKGQSSLWDLLVPGAHNRSKDFQQESY